MPSDKESGLFILISRDCCDERIQFWIEESINAINRIEKRFIDFKGTI